MQLNSDFKCGLVAFIVALLTLDRQISIKFTLYVKHPPPQLQSCIYKNFINCNIESIIDHDEDKASDQQNCAALEWASSVSIDIKELC